MSTLRWTLVGLLVAVAAACGGSVGDEGGSGVGGSSSGGTSSGGTGGIATGGGGFGGTPFGGFGGHIADAGKDAISLDGWVDPQCPDAAPPEPQFDCDPFGPNTCGTNLGCYPWVNYPTGPCDFEEYGAVCSLAGFAKQGEPCGDSSQCAAGLSCWLTGQGTECLQLCQPFGPDTCPPGLLCMGTDVEGIGACG